MLAIREIRAIYNEGVYAVAATIRQLYEMIEVEDERVLRLVASANAAHLHKSAACLRARSSCRRVCNHRHCASAIRGLCFYHVRATDQDGAGRRGVGAADAE